MTVRVLIFDLDQTLADEGVVYQGLDEVLQQLLQQGHRLFMCSYNPYADWFAKRQGIAEYFEEIIVNLEQDKGSTILELVSKLDVPLEQVLFFDDDETNVSDARQRGVSTYHVPIGGLTPTQVWQQIKQ